MSWVANLFSTAQASLLAPSSNDHSIAVVHSQDYQNDSAGYSHRRRGKQHTEMADEEEEAARSPYWHVSSRFLKKVILPLTATAKGLCSVC